MAIVRWKDRNMYDPLGDFRKLQREINDLFDFETLPSSSGLYDRHSSPAVDVIEDKESYTVLCELPGISEKDIDVSMASNVLTIKGERRISEEEEEKKTFRRESWSGSFQRTISLPTKVDHEKPVEAVLSNGILKLTLSKKEDAKAKQITVKVK